MLSDELHHLNKKNKGGKQHFILKSYHIFKGKVSGKNINMQFGGSRNLKVGAIDLL